MQVVLDLPEINIRKEDIKMFLALKLFEEGMISLGKAAEIVGYSESTFVEILLRKGISPVKFENLDPKEELANA